MTVICVLAAALVLVCAGWIYCIMPRRGQPGWEALDGVRYAHRGLHDVSAGRPENSLSAFRAAAEAGFGAELDVHLMADGALAVVHDSDLERVCGKSARIEDLRREDLAAYPLQGSGETIPLLEEVLAVFENRGPLIIELKAAGGNADALTDAVMERLTDWKGTCCLESFHPAVVMGLKKRWPSVLRGQLSQRFGPGDRSGYGRLADWAMTHLLVCVLGRPDFVAYDHRHADEPSLRLSRRLWHVHEVYWTVRDRQTMLRLEEQGGTVIFERFVPEGPAAARREGQKSE